MKQYRFFDSDLRQRKIALELYSRVAKLPLVCPHGHVDPQMFADPDYSFGTPVDLLIIPDHYVYRMLYSQGISLEQLGIPRLDGSKVETNHRRIWQIFADNFFLFAGTPTGIWLNEELSNIFGIREKLTSKSAQDIFDKISAKLTRPEFRPRKLFERFNIEVLATTDAAWDPLDSHRAIRESGWNGKIVPTFRPDGVVNMDNPNWRKNIESLSHTSGTEINSYKRYIQALENRRAYFKSMGATATDHGVLEPYTEELSKKEAESIFRKALIGKVSTSDVKRFTGHIIMENARMSIEDGLVMQLHPGAYRNYNEAIYKRFGPDTGADIPIATEYTKNLKPLLNKYGNDNRLTLVLYTLDESTFSRELAPLAGHFPALKLGPPWWFLDGLNGMQRFRESVVETAGIYNMIGFVDDTRAFPSIPARHDLARRVDASWLAGLVVRGIVDLDDAKEIIFNLVYRLAKKTFKFD